MPLGIASLQLEADANAHAVFVLTYNLHLRCIRFRDAGNKVAFVLFRFPCPSNSHSKTYQSASEVLLDEDLNTLLSQPIDPAQYQSVPKHQLRVCRAEHHNTFYVLVYVDESPNAKVCSC